MKNEKKHNKSKKQLSLRKRLLTLIMCCWVVPLTIISVFAILSYRNGVIEKTNTLLEDELKNFSEFTSYKINQGIETIKAYSDEMKSAWEDYYINDSITVDRYYRRLRNELSTRYFNDGRFSLVSFYTADEGIPCNMFRSISDYNSFKVNNVEHEVNLIGNMNTYDVFVKVIAGRIYIIRNVYTNYGLKKMGTIVVQMDNEELFRNVSKDKIYDMLVYINDSNSEVLYIEDHKMPEGEADCLSKIKEMYLTKSEKKIRKVQEQNYQGYLYQKEYEDYQMGAVLLVNQDVVYYELQSLTGMVLIVLLIIIPVIAYVLYFLGKNITSPIKKLISAYKSMEKGNIGVQVEGAPMPNEEFEYLNNSFNKMSLEVKQLFDFAYTEKLARKDAKILALQSQINPHFLNNTLEMMNWQARMAGDTTVSKMIEALSTLLDYSMDRSNKRIIRLADEIRCADAYFYIISMRFGQRLKIEKNIQTELLQFMIPQLILQPLLENAVVHGVEEAKSGIIELKAFSEDNIVVLQVINTGKEMSEEDVEWVESILAGTVDLSKLEKGKHVSLGIRNVNERIKLMYGENYGLTIRPIEDGRTAATIKIPSEPVKLREKEKLLKNIFDISK